MIYLFCLFRLVYEVSFTVQLLLDGAEKAQG